MRLAPKYVAFLAATFLGGMQSHASVVQLASGSMLSPMDATLQFTGTIGSVLPPPVSFSAGGNTLTFASSSQTPFELDQAGFNYGGTAFPNNTRILFAGGFQGAAAPVTISFAKPVTEFGFNAEEFNSGPFLVTFDVYDGQRLLGQFTSAGVDGSVLSFEGLQASGGDQITSLSVTDNNGNNIGFGPITFGTPTASIGVPEPASVALLATGIAGLGLLGCRTRPARRT